MIRREDVDAAAERIAGLVRRTPVVEVEAGGLIEHPVVCKLELLQHTGSFKPRGATNRMLAADVPAAGVIAASGGNHGAAVAFVAARLGHRAEIFVPTTSAPVKVARIAALGATVRQVGDSYQDAYEASLERADETGALSVHAFDDPAVVSGQGTVGRELDAQVPDLDTVVVAVGGGGLVAGITAWYAGTGTRVIGVEPTGCASLAAALAAGEPIDVDVSGIGVDSLGARRIGSIAFATAREAGTPVVIVEDADILRAQALLWERLRVLAEPGGATALAALTSGAYRPADGERIAIIVCGGNTDPSRFGAGAPHGRRHAHGARSMRRVVLVVAQLGAVASLLAACSSADKPGLTDAQSGDPELVVGERVYQDNCARCHGDAGGGGAGPKLSDGQVVEDFPDPAEEAELIRTGRGAMPAWEGTLTPEQIDAVVRYTREVL